MSAWSKWYGFDNYPSDIEAAVYKVRLVSQLKGKPIPIYRVGGVDLEGILFYGETGRKLKERVDSIYRTFDKGSFSGHPEAYYCWLAWPRLEECYEEPMTLEYAYRRVRDKEESEELEERCIHDYFFEFGELPPFNHKLPQKHHPL